MTSNYVAQTILSQLGGNRFVAMTGAKNMVYAANSLTVKVMGGWFLFVRLDADDTYTVETFKLRNLQRVKHTVTHGVYADKLREVFTRDTGLQTSL